MSGLYSVYYKTIPIAPTREEILNIDNSSKYELKKIVTKGSYPSAEVYLDILFKLLREDMIAPLRSGITKYLNDDQSFARELCLYENVRINEILCDQKEGIIYKVFIEIGNLRTNEWIKSGGLKYGNLLCITPMQNSLPTFDKVLWGIVVNFNTSNLKKGVFIKFQNGYEPAFELGCEYLMAESREVYFEAYAHTLAYLKNIDPVTLPMSAVILGGTKAVCCPQYLNNDTTYDFSEIFPNQQPKLSSLRVLGCWPIESSIFDTSQHKAFRLALTKQLALIQGPPGCGKTYLGAHTIKILLKTRKILIDKKNCRQQLSITENELYKSLCEQPILVVTYTNHALDQFLMYLLDFEKNMIRLGARSEVKEIKEKTLAKVRLSKYKEYKRELKQCSYLKQQMDSIEHIINDASINLARVHCKLLSKQDIESVATYPQIKSLFDLPNSQYKRILDKKEKDIINFWIDNISVDDLRKERFLMSKSRTYFLKYSHLINPIKYKILNNASKEGILDDAEEVAANKQPLKSRLINTGLLSENCSNDNTIDSYHPHGASINNLTIAVNTLNIEIIDNNNEYTAADDNDDDDVFFNDNDDDDDDADNDVDDNVNSYSIAANIDNDAKNDNNNENDGANENNNENENDDDDDDDNDNNYHILSRTYCIRDGGDLVDGNENTYNIPFKPSEDFEKLTLDKAVSCVRAENKFPRAANNSESQINNYTDVWKLSNEERKILYNYWVELRLNQLHYIVDSYSSKYCKLVQQLKEVYSDIDSYIMDKAAIIGMTTTGAAKYSHLLKKVKPTIIFVEEAAEVLEAHVIACLSQNLEHLILIGDHQQLRPANAVYQLAIDYNLNLSLFERLINNKVEHVTLNCQHRMRPEISALIKPIYPSLQNDESVLNRNDIKGVLHNIYFINHQVNEDSQSKYSTTRHNTHEAKFVAKLALYLKDQGYYKKDDITILTFYLGQKYLIEYFINEYNTGLVNIREETNITVVTVDKFQGEESTIIIFSVVRSNADSRIGFCKIDNRVCVALSRARDGFFVVGNASCLSNASKETESRLWEKVLAIFEKKMGNSLHLCCQRHNDKKTLVSKADDFLKVVHGGCNLKCDEIMPCGHRCTLHCHPYPHNIVKCNMICQRKFSCGHDCDLSSKHLCYQECPPCQVKVYKKLDICGHIKELDCSVLPIHSLCVESCLKTLQCGHKCPGKCNEDCSMHPTDLKCNISLECGHYCPGRAISCTVNQYYKLKCNQICNKIQPCGHKCKEKCHKYYMCGPCEGECRRSCMHAKCNKLCGEPCYDCAEECKWNCPHQVYTKKCRKPFRSCNKRCEQELDCGHQCLGFCGAPCPNICYNCYPEDDNFKKYFGNESNINAVFVVLEDCGHTFEAKGLDKWIDGEFKYQTSDIIVRFPHCPKCQCLILNSFRYSFLTKATLWDLRNIKSKYNEEFKLLLIGDCKNFKIFLNNFNLDKIVNCIKIFVEKVAPSLNKCRNGLKLKYFQEYLQLLTNTFLNSTPLSASKIAQNRIINFSEDSTDYIIFVIKDYSESVNMTRKLKILMRICKLVIKIENVISRNLLGSDDNKNLLYIKKDILSEPTNFTLNKLDEYEKELNKTPDESISTDQLKSSFVFRTPKETCGGDWYKCRNKHVYKAKLDNAGQPKLICPDCFESGIPSLP